MVLAFGVGADQLIDAGADVVVLRHLQLARGVGLEHRSAEDDAAANQLDKGVREQEDEDAEGHRPQPLGLLHVVLVDELVGQVARRLRGRRGVDHVGHSASCRR